MKTIVVYHNDYDGHASALIAFAALGYGDDKNPVEFIEAKYGDAPPEVKEGDTVFLLDFTFSADILKRWHEICRELIVLDHHIFAIKENAGQPYMKHCDPTVAGCIVTWRYFYGAEEVQILYRHVADYDMWRFEIPYTREFCLYLDTLKPVDPDHPFTRLLDCELGMCLYEGGDIRHIYEIGKALKRLMDKQVANTGGNPGWIKFGGKVVPIVNATSFHSSVGEFLYTRYCECDFSMTYSVEKTEARVSLRSMGKLDVSKLAKKFFGGGHKNSSGFTVESEILVRHIVATPELAMCAADFMVESVFYDEENVVD